MKTKQILLCMLLACFVIPSLAQNRWGIMGGGLLSKSTAKDSYFRAGGYVGGLYDMKVKGCFFIQPQLLFTYEEFRTNRPKLISSSTDFYSKYSLELPLLASFSVRVNQKVNLRFNVGPYLSYAFFGRTRENSGLGWWHQDFWNHFTYGVKGGISLETTNFFYTIDCNYSLDKNLFFQNGHELTLSGGMGYKF